MDRNDSDPFGSLASLCLMSDSQQDLLRHRPIAGDSNSDEASESSDSEPFRLESTGISMVSPPESSEQKDASTPLDVFQTPPEQPAAADSDDNRLEVEMADAEDEELAVEGGCAEDEKAVDLGRDTDLGFSSEVQLTQTVEIPNVDESVRVISVCGSKVSGSDAKDGAISSCELSWEVRLGESPSKKLKSSVGNLASGSSSRTVTAKSPVKVGAISSSDRNNEMTEELRMETNNGDEDSGGNCSTKRELKFPDETEIFHSEELQEVELIENVVENAENKGTADGVKVCNGDNGEFQRNDHRKGAERETIDHHHQFCRQLPPSITGAKNDTDIPPSEHVKEITILDVLKILKGKEESDDEDDSFSNLSILEVAKRRGMTFPRPRWWPDEQATEENQQPEADFRH